MLFRSCSCWLQFLARFLGASPLVLNIATDKPSSAAPGPPVQPASRSTAPPSTPTTHTQLAGRASHLPAAEQEAVGPLAAPPLPRLKQLNGAVVAREAGLCPAGCTPVELCQHVQKGGGRQSERCGTKQSMRLRQKILPGSDTSLGGKVVCLSGLQT